MSQNSSYKCKTVKHSSIENHKAQLHKVGRWILTMIKLSSTQGIINSDQENCFLDFGKEKSNPLHSNSKMHILHTVLHTYPKVLTRRICLINNQELLKLVIISFVLPTYIFDSVVFL